MEGWRTCWLRGWVVVAILLHVHIQGRDQVHHWFQGQRPYLPETLESVEGRDLEVSALILDAGSVLGLETSLRRVLLPVIGSGGGGEAGFLGRWDSFFDQSYLGKDVGEAFGDGKGASLGVHVQLVVCTQLYMLAVGVAAIVSESSSSFFSVDFQASMAANKDVLSHFRLIPGGVQCFVGEDGKVCFHLVVVPGGVLQDNYLFGFA